MYQIVLGTKNHDVKRLFGDPSRFQVSEFSQTDLCEMASPSSDCLFILDQGIFRDLTAEQRQSLDGALKLLLIDSGKDISPENRFHSGCVYFFLENGVETSLHNLQTLAKSLLKERIIEGRLNSYIRDSFSDIVDSNLLNKQKKEIEELNEKLREMSRTDYLTNLLNRRALLESFELEKTRALRCRWRIRGLETGKTPSVPSSGIEYKSQGEGDIQEHLGNFSCLMIDIDHFKKVNDTYGHLVGDMVLKQFSELIRMQGLFRETDVMGRYGGEEFVILLPETNSEHAVIPAERLRATMKDIVFQDLQKRQFHVTISIGVSEFLPEEVSSEEMIKRADEALYYAKEHGRDQVCVYESATGRIVPAFAKTL